MKFIATLKKPSTFMLMFALTALLAGCGSSKKKQEQSDEPPVSSVSDASEDMSDNLMLNGDSDSGKAGPLRSVYFAYDSSMLTGEAKSVLDANAEFLKASSSIEIQVEGHCDERGGVQYNIALGERRAKAIKDYLSAMGVNASRITTVSYGKERPLEFGHTETSWSKNRRGNFVVTAK